MPRCARDGCGRWRPAITTLGGRWGVHFDGAWYCSTSCVEQAAVQWLRDARESMRPSAAAPSPLRIGAILQHLNGLSSDTIRAALAAQRRSGARLGAELVRMGAATSGDVLRALALQAGVSYAAAPGVSVGRSVPREVPADVVRALGVVPLSLDRARQRVIVACTAPVPRLAISALVRISGRAVDPLLVGDDVLPRLIEEYAAGTVTASAAASASVSTLATAASRMVQAARAQRAERVVSARCGSHVWLRLEGDRAHEHLLLPIGAFQEGEPCPAAPMRP